MSDAEGLKQHLIQKSRDPSFPMTTSERALYSLLTLPIKAQEICTEAEREEVIQSVRAAMDAAVKASMGRAQQ